MSKKVANIISGGIHLECIQTEDRDTPYKVYICTDRYHRRQLAKYSSFLAAIGFIRWIYYEGANVLPLPDLMTWTDKNRELF